MKKTLKSIIVLFLSIIIMQSCMPEPIFYHSEASLPFFHRSTKTVFELIKDDNATNDFKFGVISAKDDDTLSYVLLAPTTPAKIVRDLVDVNLTYSIPLLPAQVKEFIKILDSSVKEWSKDYNYTDGMTYEFLVSPENRIVQRSENVVEWYSTFKYYFQNNEDGPLGSVIFGEGQLQYLYKIEKLSAIKDLSSMLSKAISK